MCVCVSLCLCLRLCMYLSLCLCFAFPGATTHTQTHTYVFSSFYNLFEKRRAARTAGRPPRTRPRRWGEGAPGEAKLHKTTRRHRRAAARSSDSAEQQGRHAMPTGSRHHDRQARGAKYLNQSSEHGETGRVSRVQSVTNIYHNSVGSMLTS